MTKTFLMEVIAEKYRSDALDSILWGYVHGVEAAYRSLGQRPPSVLAIVQMFIVEFDLENVMSREWGSAIKCRMDGKMRRSGGKLG